MKQKMMEEEQRGFSSKDTNVCANCFEDAHVIDFIKLNQNNNTCDYCSNEEQESIISTDFDIVMQFIMDGIRSEYEDPTGCMFHDSREGGFQGAVTIETYDLIHDYIAPEIGTDNERLIEDIIDCIHNYLWCFNDPYALRIHEELYYGWESFSNYVKHIKRYFFLTDSFHEQSDSLELINSPLDLLSYIGNYVSDPGMGLIKELKKDSVIYRGRAHDLKEGLITVEKLGPPLPEQAKYANRMNPAGISAFYGACDKETVVEEIKSDINHNIKKEYITIGKFILQQPLLMLDLSELPAAPSLFDEERRHLRYPNIFFQKFIEDVSKSIKKDGRENIEYIPTQIVAEYFKHVYRTSNENNKLNGILYPSSRNDLGVNCFLFLSREDVSADNLEEKKITLISSAIETIKIGNSNPEL